NLRHQRSVGNLVSQHRRSLELFDASGAVAQIPGTSAGHEHCARHNLFGHSATRCQLAREAQREFLAPLQKIDFCCQRNGVRVICPARLYLLQRSPKQARPKNVVRIFDGLGRHFGPQCTEGREFGEPLERDSAAETRSARERPSSGAVARPILTAPPKLSSSPVLPRPTWSVIRRATSSAVDPSV